MDYIYFNFEGDCYWIAVSKKGCVERQVIEQKDGNSLISCTEDCLAEGEIEKYYIKENKIDKQIFEIKWIECTKKYRNLWNKTKKVYIIGKELEGRILYFYPQGIIFYLGEIRGIADYEQYRKKSSSSNLYPGHKITGEVIAYDETNMWIIIGGGYII